MTVGQAWPGHGVSPVPVPAPAPGSDPEHTEGTMRGSTTAAEIEGEARERVEPADSARREPRFTPAAQPLDDALRQRPHDRSLRFEAVELHPARRELDAAISAVDEVLAEDAAQGHTRDDAHERHLAGKALMQLERRDPEGASGTIHLAEAPFPGSLPGTRRSGPRGDIGFPPARAGPGLKP
jgi:hypothetical protein